MTNPRFSGKCQALIEKNTTFSTKIYSTGNRFCKKKNSLRKNYIYRGKIPESRGKSSIAKIRPLSEAALLKILIKIRFITLN